MQLVLIQGNEVFVAEQLQCLGLDVGHIASYEQRRSHDAPHSEVRLVFNLAHGTSYLQHIHIVVMTVVAISRQIEVLGQNTLHGAPGIVDVACCTPRVGYFGTPCSGECPAAHVIDNIFLSAVLDGVGNLGVLLLFVKPHVGSAAVVNLDEVEVPVAEVQLAVLGLVSGKADTNAPCMLVS